MSARVAAMAARVSHRRRSLAILEGATTEAVDQVVLTPAQALAAEVLLLDASLAEGEPGADVWLEGVDWSRLVALARKVGGT